MSWSHYLVLMRVDNPDARSFYEIECAKQNWSVRWLQRQVGSSLYERIALSKDKNEVLKPDSSYSETKLEAAIIKKMQTFLLELGKG